MLNGVVRAVCPVCGSIKTNITDRRFADEGYRLVCDSCKHREFQKDLSDFDFISNMQVPKKGSTKQTRGKAYRRHKDYTKAIRKRNISNELYFSITGHPYYPHLHQYSKNKIHCSCPMCTDKSKGKSGWNIKPSEARRMGLYNLRRQRNGLSKLVTA